MTMATINLDTGKLYHAPDDIRESIAGGERLTALTRWESSVLRPMHRHDRCAKLAEMRRERAACPRPSARSARLSSMLVAAAISAGITKPSSN